MLTLSGTECRGGAAIEAHPEPNAAYEQILRLLGARLDAKQPSRFVIVEAPDGFTLLMQHGHDDVVIEQQEFTHDALQREADHLPGQRRILGSAYRGGWDLGPTGRQDFLHALGFELDDSEATSILIDELDDSLIVTYSALDPQAGYSYRKYMRVLGAREIEEILRHAYARRKKRSFIPHRR